VCGGRGGCSLGRFGTGYRPAGNKPRSGHWQTRERGETRISIATEKGRQIREAWTDQLRSLLQDYNPDFGILAGFVPLTNITGDFPCLNVHPGDLTYEKNGQRYLVGLHTFPIERAILEDLGTMRSSVIVAEPYSGDGGDMDSGPILGVSEPVAIDLGGTSLAELPAIAASRPAKRPLGGYKDRLEEVAKVNLERLKVDGDWQVFPRVVFDFSRHLFARQEDGLCFQVGDQWVPIETIAYGSGGREIIFRNPS